MKKRIWIAAGFCLIALMVCAFWIRVLPLFNLGNSDIAGIVDSTDSLYILRQVELGMRNFPAYAYFDPMTAYPSGQTVGLGPLFAWICSGLCLAAGATARDEIVRTALLVPPVLAAFMIPVIFLLVRRTADSKTGLAAAGLAAVVGGSYFYYSLFGHFDHHMADVLFSTVFCLCFLYAVSYATDHANSLRQGKTAITLLMLSLVSGIAFSIGLLTTPLMILFGLLLVLYTAVMFLYDFYHDRDSGYILVMDLVIFGCAIGILLVNGIQAPGLNLYEYSWGQPAAYLLAIAGVVTLYAVVRAFGWGKGIVYPLLVLCTGIGGLLGLFFLIPEIPASLVAGYNIFFGFNPNAALVQETQNWSLLRGWQSFGAGLMLAAGGYLITVWRSKKKYQPQLVFLLVWSSLMALVTWRQARNEYYLAVTIVILSAICMVFFLERGYNVFSAIMSAGRQTRNLPATGESGSGGTKRIFRQAAPYMHVFLCVLVVLLSCSFVITSVTSGYQSASERNTHGVKAEWLEAMAWLQANTPDTGVDYYRIYDRATFRYPYQSYGILTWWDYGNVITFFARRIPNANPFQSGVGESAGFFMADSEEKADGIADTGGIRYIVTDIRSASIYLPSIARAYNASEGMVPYREPFLLPAPENPDRFRTATFYKKPFFDLMLVRLHFFDGSMLQPGRVVYLEYNLPTTWTRGMKVITSVKTLDWENRSTATAAETGRPPKGTGAEIVSTSYLLPAKMAPALRHYRLVYESPGSPGGNSAERYLKIFEYVPGARITGNGIIEVSLTTNGGRQFDYRQASIDGEFIVPYSTIGNPYNVSATGKYRIIGTEKEFDVSEEAVQKGLNASQS